MHTTHVDDLIPTHGLTMNINDFKDLTNDIYQNGINTPITYVNHNGEKYIVGGHHRASVASNLEMGQVPTIQVGLPYKGYDTVNDLRYSDF